MDRVKLDLKNCYGIKNLQTELDFKKTRACAIYAPNGVMKSSLAKTFEDAAAGIPSTDRIFPTRATMRSITDEKGKEIAKDSIIVVLPYDEQFGISERTSTLLLDAKLKKEYDDLLREVAKARQALVQAIQTQSGAKRDFGAEISTTFMRTPNEFDGALHRIRKELEEQKDTPYAQVEYDTVFNDKVVTALNTKNLKASVEDFVRRYNELLGASTYFKKGVFDYYNAGQIAKSLADNGFFTALHTVSLRAKAGNREIATQKELEDVINEDKNTILKDKTLRKTFDDISKALYKNVELRTFCTYLQNNEPLLARMGNPEKFKEDVLKSYIKTHDALYRDWLTKDGLASEGRKKIEEEAKKQNSQWEKVIDIFNARFTVPFKLEVKNKIQVTLGADNIIDLGFVYQDGGDSIEVQRAALLKALSTGERKALYVLNVIFEIETRKNSTTETLIVVDDLADSFDYQNKYAIIEYLKEISEDGRFKLIIMTHNFDFFRTVESRFVGGANCLMASKNATGTTLAKAVGVRNVFGGWKKLFFTNSKIKIASIPFLRNLIEMTVGGADPNYQTLTALLHLKAGSDTITVGDLDAIFIATCRASGSSADTAKPVLDLLTEEAKACLTGPLGLNLENKIVLAIAIRVAAERFMINKIGDPPFVAAITSNQTPVLIKRFKTDFPAEQEAISALDQVSLMTPENIHVNSFMYEPIIDMADDHLQRLYRRVEALK